MKWNKWSVFFIFAFLVLIVYATVAANRREQEQEAARQAQAIAREEYGNYSGITTEVTRVGNDVFQVDCKINITGELYDIKGSPSFRIYDDGENEWEARGLTREGLTYVFKKNNHYYHWYPYRTVTNYSELFRFIVIDQSHAKLDVYSHDLGYLGRDEYDHRVERVEFTYNEDEHCFEFHHGRDWRIYPDVLKVDKGVKRSACPTVEFKENKPVDPNDYWWYKRAVKIGA